MELQYFILPHYTTVKGVEYDQISTSYQIFGQPLGEAPVVMVFHALTGNSDVCSDESGWWKGVINYKKVIDLNRYTVLALDILGNGYDGTFIENYRDFVAKDIAIIAHNLVTSLNISSLYAVIGGSLGGGIAWEYALLYDRHVERIISVAADWKSTDWVMGITGTQEQILLNSSKPLADARRMAMLFYRTPNSLKRKFGRKKQTADLYQVNSWLNHHGKRLEERFNKKAYLMMNDLLGSIDYEGTNDQKLPSITCEVVQIAISSDLLFLPDEIRETKDILDKAGVTNQYYEIESKDGHDAFLIEDIQINAFLKNHF